MKKRIIAGIFLLIILTTIISKNKIAITIFNIKNIEIENNFLLKKKEIKILLAPLYKKNLFFIKNNQIQDILIKNSFIESFEIKKRYPDSIIIKVYEKKPIAILFYKKKRFFISEKMDLIDFKDFVEFQNLPYVFGNIDQFKIFYKELKNINFPLGTIKKYTLYDSKRWDIETRNKKIVKLPNKNYTESLRNYLNLIIKKNFQKYEIFDYRINNQLILK